MSSDTESSLPRAGYLPVCYRCAPAHAPRPAGTGMRSQRAECCSAPPPGPPPPSRPPPVQRSAERPLSLAPQRRSAYYSERPGCAGRRRGRESARGGAGRGGQGRPTRTALGIPTVAIRHTATQALSGGPATPGPAASPPVRGPSPSRARRRGVLRVLRFFRIPAARTRAEPEPDLPRTPAQPKRRALFSTC